ncbi:hypothetical protein CW751_13430 [Brumimicrobium salinarum]|uniref:Uncharacterized protein n=1 Tax=Brumimicrobium salinarum TaxID=2058658 RepID=A0A2I0QZG3_9FLAO|nr:hypothetical protein [Brumimicrobium salinarum]PKR79721.1 hypothetical protein CW751_13430 [Brumimicrobium salinarum]
MKTLLKFLLLPFLFLLALFACKKEQPEILNAEDPCDCASEVSADFEIREALNNGAPSINMYTVTDDILAYKTAYFKAKEADAEYTWYIGADIETDRETAKFFPGQWAGSVIPITLVVEKEPNTICFPNDDGYDSITKYMGVHSFCDSSIMEGTFRVAEENSIDSFDIVFDLELAYAAPGVLSNSNCSRLDFYNYDRNGSNCVGYDNVMARNYRAFRSGIFSNWGGASHECGDLLIKKCYLDLNNQLFLSYEYWHVNDPEAIELNVNGRKLN